MNDPAIVGKFQKWKKAAFFAPVILVVIFIYRSITELNQAPVNAQYEAYLKQLASLSTTAAAYQQNYFAQFRRTTVAAGDFMLVCANMLFIVESQGQTPGRSDEQLTTLCRNSPGRIDKDFFEKTARSRSVN